MNAASHPPQFSLRTLFAVVVLAAVLLAWLGPRVRESQAWRHEGFLSVWAGALVSSSVVLVISVALRMRSGALAGGPLARLRFPWYSRVALLLLGALLVWLLVRTSIVAAATASRPEDRAFSFLIGAVVGFAAPVPWLLAVFDDGYPQLREAGFFETYGFHRWDEVLEYHFQERPRLTLEVQLSDGKLSLPLAARHRDTVAAVFAQRTEPVDKTAG